MDNYTNPNDTVPSVFDEMEQYAMPEYATTGQRFVNYLIDILVVYASIYAAGIFLGLLSLVTGGWINVLIDDTTTATLLNYLIAFVMTVVTYALIEGLSRGRTLGKLVTKTKAVREDGQPFGWADAWRRSLCRIVPFDQLSALGGHPWHDSWTKTRVIKI